MTSPRRSAHKRSTKADDAGRTRNQETPRPAEPTKDEPLGAWEPTGTPETASESTRVSASTAADQGFSSGA